MEENNTNNPTLAGAGSPTPNNNEIKPPTPEANPYTPNTDPVKFASPFNPQATDGPEIKKVMDFPGTVNQSNNDILSAIKSDGPVSNTAQEVKTTPTIDSSSYTKVETSNNIKKPRTGLFIFITIFLMLLSAAGAGIAVYTWQNSQSETMQKDKAMLQSKVSNLQNQVETLSQENTTLKSDLEDIRNGLTAKENMVETSESQPAEQPATAGTAADPTSAPASGQPGASSAAAPGMPETSSPPTQ